MKHERTTLDQVLSSRRAAYEPENLGSDERELKIVV
jgi:hypothetical protein